MSEPEAEGETDVAEGATRRTYTARSKFEMLAEYEGRGRTGKGAQLRREGCTRR